MKKYFTKTSYRTQAKNNLQKDIAGLENSYDGILLNGDDAKKDFISVVKSTVAMKNEKYPRCAKVEVRDYDSKKKQSIRRIPRCLCGRAFCGEYLRGKAGTMKSLDARICEAMTFARTIEEQANMIINVWAYDERQAIDMYNDLVTFIKNNHANISRHRTKEAD